MVINDEIDGRKIVLIGDPDSRTVRAYESDGLDFAAHGTNKEILVADMNEWRITEEALVSGGNKRLSRLPGHIAYWFAWQNFRPDAETRFQ